MAHYCIYSIELIWRANRPSQPLSDHPRWFPTPILPCQSLFSPVDPWTRGHPFSPFSRFAPFFSRHALRAHEHLSSRPRSYIVDPHWRSCQHVVPQGHPRSHTPLLTKPYHGLYCVRQAAIDDREINVLPRASISTLDPKLMPTVFPEWSP